jgi:hypothetical protein
MSQYYQGILAKIQADPRYQRNLDWGKPRRGHPEGTVRAHIEELERNLDRLHSKLSDVEHWKVKILIHTHDTFKAEAKLGVAIVNPCSHASLARAFLAEFCFDWDLLSMIQFHDVPYSLWRHVSRHGSYDAQRLLDLLATVVDWNVFSAFLIVDGCTRGKSRDPLIWFFAEIGDLVQAKFTAADILPPEPESPS